MCRWVGEWDCGAAIHYLPPVGLGQEEGGVRIGRGPLRRPRGGSLPSGPCQASSLPSLAARRLRRACRTPWTELWGEPSRSGPVRSLLDCPHNPTPPPLPPSPPPIPLCSLPLARGLRACRTPGPSCGLSHPEVDQCIFHWIVLTPPPPLSLARFLLARGLRACRTLWTNLWAEPSRSGPVRSPLRCSQTQNPPPPFAHFPWPEASEPAGLCGPSCGPSHPEVGQCVLHWIVLTPPPPLLTHSPWPEAWGPAGP